MQTSPLTQTIGELVRDNPARSRVFERFAIDYCCGGKVPLQEACRDRGLDPEQVAAELAVVDAAPVAQAENPATMGLAALADHIEATHHAYLREELPRLDALTLKVASVHGQMNPSLHEVRECFVECREELEAHMIKEEHVLFPMIRELESPTSCACGTPRSISGPIRMMEAEHESAGGALERMHALTNGYTPPEGACNTYRAMLNGLAAFEHDMHQHVHKENNVLFPRALEHEATLKKSAR
jgi:regulator of cell morphogenesis and NO signaling